MGLLRRWSDCGGWQCAVQCPFPFAALTDLLFIDLGRQYPMRLHAASSEATDSFQEATVRTGTRKKAYAHVSPDGAGPRGTSTALIGS